MKLKLWYQGGNSSSNEFTFIDEEHPRIAYVIKEHRNLFTIDKIEQSPRGEQIGTHKTVLAIYLTSDGSIDYDTSFRRISNKELDAFSQLIPQYDDIWRIACCIGAEPEYTIKPFDRLFKIKGTP